MKITGLSVSGFRGFPNPQWFDLDADAVVVVGVNGQGKTSLFDAILWGLTGAIPRLGDDSRLVSMYSSSGEARVTVDLRTASGVKLTVSRSSDGDNQQLRITHDGDNTDGDAARVKLIATLWPEASHTPDGPAALMSAFTRSVYLQQDLVREFIEADDEQQRFTAVSELVGAGRVTDLSLALERAKSSWSRASNVKTGDLEIARSKLASAEARLAALAQPVSDAFDVEAAWTRWWDEETKLTEGSEPPPLLEAADAAHVLDSAVKRIDARRLALERRIDQLADLERELATEANQPVLPGRPELEDAVVKSEERLAATRERLQRAQESASEQRRLQVALHETQAELRAIAELSMRHLDGRCPVCGQEQDQAATQSRLEKLLASTAKATDGRGSDVEDEVAGLAAEIQELELVHSRALADLRAVETEEQERERVRAERARRMDELGLAEGVSEPTDAVRRAISDTRRTVRELVAHRTAGETLALEIALAGERARRGELELQADHQRAEVAKLEELVDSREQTGELAAVVLEGLRNAAADVVAAQLDQIDPILQRIYATADPHPSFRAVSLLTKVARGRGRLNASVFDPTADLSSDSPATVLSSSQLNALAVSVFLALNLGIPALPMRAVMLDDPLQSLDDVNLLGLIDLLRRAKDQRQLLVSTHDMRFGRLLARKLRPVSAASRTRLITLGAWGPEGPAVAQDDVAHDPEHLRIAA